MSRSLVNGRGLVAGALVTGFAALILCAYVGLIPMGSWRPDEYHDFGSFREHGWTFFFRRLLTWSPRPLSETIVGLYYLFEESTARQLVAPFLAAMWAPLLLGPVLYVRRSPPGGRSSRMLIAAVVLCLFFLGHSVAEVFYWPMGAVAYATTLAAICALTFQMLDGRWRRRGGRLFCVICLLCAAGLAELGAIFAIFAGACMVLLHGAGLAGTRRDALLWLLPLAFGIVVMVFLALGRGTLDERIVYLGASPNPTYMGHPVPSLLRAIPTYARQLFVLDGAEGGVSAITTGAAIKIVAGLGLLAVVWTERTARPPREESWVLAALLLSLLLTVFVSIAGSYYKFGLVCCERHDTMRQCLLTLTALCGVTLIARALPPLRDGAALRTVGAALLGLVLVVLLVRQLPALEAAYADRRATIRLHRANWAAGHAPGEAMVFLMAPLPPVVGGMTPPERGTYELGADPPWLWKLVMTFFGKREITLRPVG